MQKKRDKINTDEDDIDWLKLKREHLARVRLAKEQLQAEMGADMANLNAEQQDPEAMFLQDETPPPVQKKRALEHDLLGDDDEEDRYALRILSSSIRINIPQCRNASTTGQEEEASQEGRACQKAF